MFSSLRSWALRGILVLALVVPLLAYAEAPLSHERLANGLEVFIVEDHSAPLATVCLVFRGGAIAQTPQTAGLFHLYEHMLFAGNDRYPSQGAFIAALKRMGVANWNGATGTEYINYYITIPSSRIAEGIEFWSHAVISPLFDPAKLELEKEVVINEIRGYHTDPDNIADNALSSRSFAQYPWRKNIEGPVANIQAATVASLQAMRDAWYIPPNTALLVAGDVDPAEVRALTTRWFGAWGSSPVTGSGTAAQAAAPVIAEPPQGPYPADIRFLYSDANYYNGVTQVQFRWRGPDVLRQTADTYTSDVLLYLLSSPVGRFKSTLMEKGPGLYDPEYISFSYPTARDGAEFIFSTFLLTSVPGQPSLAERAEALRRLILDEFKIMAQDPAAYFGEEELALAKVKLADQNIISMERSRNFITRTLTFWWAVASTDYFFGYEEACAAVSFADIASLLDRYFGAKPSATLLRVRTTSLTGDASRQAQALGYATVDPDTAFWWQIQGGSR